MLGAAYYGQTKFGTRRVKEHICATDSVRQALSIHSMTPLLALWDTSC